jgi:hypothetical protein
MKVVCIKDDYKTFDPTSTYKSRTTIGKTYELIQYEDSYGDIGYYFIDDFGEETWIGFKKVKLDNRWYDKPIFFEKYFVTLEQWREQQLNKILEQ